MSTEHDLTLLIQTAKGLAKLMGSETEIVLHDLIEHKNCIYRQWPHHWTFCWISIKRKHAH
mgnify:CR=1 FL=1